MVFVEVNVKLQNTSRQLLHLSFTVTDLYVMQSTAFDHCLAAI